MEEQTGELLTVCGQASCMCDVIDGCLRNTMRASSCFCDVTWNVFFVRSSRWSKDI